MEKSIIMLCPMKSPSPVILSHQNPSTYLFRTDLDCFHNLFEVKNFLIMNLFFKTCRFFPSQDINWWTGVMWITCGLLWCFYQLFGLSFWRHPFTAEDPMVSKWCNATFLHISMKKLTLLHLVWPEGEYILSKFSFLGELFLEGHLLPHIEPWCSNGKCEFEPGFCCVLIVLKCLLLPTDAF